MPLSANPTTILHGTQTVTTAGTPEALNSDSSLPVPTGIAVLVVADPNNTGIVYVADGDNTRSDGIPLEYPNGVGFEVDDVSVIHVDADNSGDSVRWAFEGGPL